MYQDSLDGIRSKLKTAFPTITRTYIDNVPDGFVRPSFFITLITTNNQNLNKNKYTTRILWQIVYFAAENAAGNTGSSSQNSVLDTLNSTFSALFIKSPTNVAYDIKGFEANKRDNEIYCTLALECQSARTEETYELMEEINVNEEV